MISIRQILSRLTGRESRRLRDDLCAVIAANDRRMGEIRQRHEQEVGELMKELGRSNQAAIAYRAEAAVCRSLAEDRGALLRRKEDR